MDTEQCDVRFAGTAVYLDSSAGYSSRMAVTCRTCGARTGLALSAGGEDAWISCPAGHKTQDWRLTADAVRDVAATAAEAGIRVVPADAEIWVRVPVSTGNRPDCEDIA
ncbi:hypothetical protein [Streptomyces sp. NPDC024089]|uniref:hypothetical protein n=1 Tax=Streptomyces sp. NPDC024089 TaxID=3154328 RepID=UPI0033CB26D7